MLHDRGQRASVERRDSLLVQPFARNLYLDATYAQGAPHNLATLACDVLMVLREVHVHGESAALETFHRTLHEKNRNKPLTYAFHSGIKTTCMALRHLVVTTETAVRDPFRKTANVTETSSLRLCGEPPMDSSDGVQRVVKISEGGNAHGC